MTALLRTTALALCLGAASLTPARAQMAVYDASNFAQLVEQLEQMAQTYEAEIQQLNSLRQQYETAVNHLESITGARGMQYVLNSLEDIAARGASADGMIAIVDGAIAGTPVSGNTAVINRTLDELRETYELASLPEFSDSEFAQDRAIATEAGSGMAAIATAEDAYRRSNESMDRVTALVELIDDNMDLKASIDFNTRVLAEVAFILNENLRVQASIANALGADALADARDGVSSRQFLLLGGENN